MTDTDLRPYIASGYEVSTWYDHQVYDGVNPIVMGVTNYVVPAIGDFVINISGTTVIRYRVISRSELNVSTLERVWEDTLTEGIVDLTVSDLSSVAMILVRNSVSPVMAAIHIGLPLESSNFISYGKVYLGTDINDLDAVVSRRYDTDGVVTDTKVTITADTLNSNVYLADWFNLDRMVTDKAMGTFVAYGSDDLPLFKYTIIFRVSDSLVNYASTELFITDLVLESVNLNPVNDKEILVKRGFVNSTFNPRVFKVFNNSDQREEISITSSSLVLEGWGGYILGRENDVYPLSVQYKLASNEVSDMISDESGTVITSSYTIRVIDDVDTTNYKLYPVLTWDTDEEGYSLRFFMYDSTYKTAVDATDLVSLSTPLSGYDYINKQTFNYSLNLLEAGITQEESFARGSFAIRLYSDPMDMTTPFAIYMIPTDEERYYGAALRTRCVYDLDVYTITIDSDYTTYEEWLDNVYYKLLPAYDSNTNTQAPAPTKCDVTIDGDMVTFDILTQWNVGVSWTNTVPVGKHVVTLEWYSFDADNGRNDLAISSMQLEIV